MSEPFGLLSGARIASQTIAREQGVGDPMPEPKYEFDQTMSW